MTIKKDLRYKTSPIYPDRVLQVVRLHDIDRLSFRDIARRIGGTHAGVRSTYQRWRDWAYETAESPKPRLFRSLTPQNRQSA